MKHLPKTVLVLGLVSFFNDLSSEMIYPLLPVFLSSVLGAGVVALGLVEGVAESTASLLKIVSGYLTDRWGKKKPFITAGYGLSGLVRPLIGLAWAWPVVLVARFADRIGKGLRTSPRDALIAASTLPSMRGRAYGFHRAMDHAGAVVGPLVAAFLLGLGGLDLGTVFLLAVVPALVMMGLIFAGVKEPDRPRETAARNPGLGRQQWRGLGRDYKRLLVTVVVFTLGNSTDAFILLRLSDAGVPAAWIAILWALHHVVKSGATFAGGYGADRLGRRRMITAGWVLYGLVYLGFALADGVVPLVALFMVYGVYYGWTEPCERAWVADLSPGGACGTAFGFYHGAVGLAALPASILFGLLWQAWGMPAAFVTGAVLAFAAALLLPAEPVVSAAGQETCREAEN